MKNLLTAVFGILCFTLFSCQKEVDDIFKSNGSSTGTQLVKIVSKSGSDSSSLIFGYNSSNKLSTLNSSATVSGIAASFSERAERNAQGIIQRIILKSDQYQQAGLDSVITNILYGEGQYKAKVTLIDLGGGIGFIDSTALSYDGSGKVVREDSYVGIAGIYDTVSKVEYTYNGNNIALMKNYSYDPSTGLYELEETYSYDQYDDKLSPMYFGMEAFVFSSPLFYSSNNPIKSSLTTQGSTITYSVTYTYNSFNKPVSATSIVQPGNTSSTGTYYYQ